MCAVTFLALGNGAPDISASIAAIGAGNYDLAMGSLLGMPQSLSTMTASLHSTTVKSAA